MPTEQEREMLRLHEQAVMESRYSGIRHAPQTKKQELAKYYALHKEEILARRRERQAQMSPEQLAEIQRRKDDYEKSLKGEQLRLRRESKAAKDRLRRERMTPEELTTYKQEQHQRYVARREAKKQLEAIHEKPSYSKYARYSPEELEEESYRPDLTGEEIDHMLHTSRMQMYQHRHDEEARGSAYTSYANLLSHPNLHETTRRREEGILSERQVSRYYALAPEDIENLKSYLKPPS